jgi:4'-phosphopantetheinyl transferase
MWLQALENEIHLWVCDYQAICDAALNGYRAMLSIEELEQELRFYFPRDRRRYLVTRALVRTVLSRYADVLPKQWIFSANPFGRPEIANLKQCDFRLSFNVSHTDSLIVVGVADGRSLGVDIENIVDRDVSISLASQFFSSDEVAALMNLPSARRRDRFFEYWTFKEAYIKARGMGLSIPLNKFGFDCSRDRVVQIVIAPDLGDDPNRWEFWQFRPSPEYLIAVCAERVASGCPTIVMRDIVPAQSESILNIPFTRSSGASSPRRAAYRPV